MENNRSALRYVGKSKAHAGLLTRSPKRFHQTEFTDPWINSYHSFLFFLILILSNDSILYLESQTAGHKLYHKVRHSFNHSKGSHTPPRHAEERLGTIIGMIHIKKKNHFALRFIQQIFIEPQRLEVLVVQIIIVVLPVCMGFSQWQPPFSHITSSQGIYEGQSSGGEHKFTPFPPALLLSLLARPLSSPFSQTSLLSLFLLITSISLLISTLWGHKKRERDVATKWSLLTQEEVPELASLIHPLSKPGWCLPVTWLLLFLSQSCSHVFLKMTTPCIISSWQPHPTPRCMLALTVPSKTRGIFLTSPLPATHLFFQEQILFPSISALRGKKRGDFLPFW